jgi:DNA phosphorothioation-dependent restriction protein DptG
LLTRDNAVEVASSPSVELLFIRSWLKDAFDAYVLNGADLESELADAEQKATDFLACLDDADSTADAYRTIVSNCAQSVGS